LNLRHWETRLGTEHSKTSTSRFSAATPGNPLHRLLYLGENHQVAMFEVEAMMGHPDSPISNPKGSWVLMSLDLLLHHVVNLSEEGQQSLIGTNRQELTGGWANYDGIAPTQKLSAALHAVPRLEGVIYPSSKVGSRNLAVFMDKLSSKSSVAFRNDLSGEAERLN
jgi:hypothetical protein